VESLAHLFWESVGLSAASFGALLLTSVFTSAVTAAFGMGGGLVMLALLGNLLPAPAVVPVHGVIQLGSNVGRAVVFRRQIVWPFFAFFAAGAALGTVAGSALVVRLPEPLLYTALGLFLLASAWRPRLGIAAQRPVWLTPLGAFASFLTMFVGATGPFVAAALSSFRLPRHRLIGTHAAMMLLQHGLKVAAFGVLGFVYGPWLPLIGALMAAGFLGTLLGRKALDRLPERTFACLFRALLALLAARLLYVAAS
jgi:uncharacterized protein